MRIRSFARPLTTATLFAGASFAAMAAASAAPAGAPLIAHRAVYDLDLASSQDNGSAPVGARGRIVYEFTGSPCEGWVTNFRQVTELQMNEGGERVSDMRSSTYEEGDGAGFQFKTDTLVNGQKVESVDGGARKTNEGGLAITLSKPTPSKTNLDSGAVFPTAQILRIMDAAREGKKTAQIKIYDGSESGQKEFDTMTVIGKRKDGQSPEAADLHADKLAGVPRWPVSVSYFDPQKPDGEPNYILDFDLYENGVSGSLKINYGSYVLSGKMVKFEALPQKSCD